MKVIDNYTVSIRSSEVMKVIKKMKKMKNNYLKRT